MHEETETVCAVFHRAVELIGRRWTGAIVQVLLRAQEPTRYCELRAAVPDVSDRMLSERLRELEAEGIVTRLVIPETPIRVEYALTKKGRALEPALDAIAEWAGRWDTPRHAAAPRAASARASAADAPKRRARS